MNIERLVGSAGVRWATAALATVTAIAAMLYARDVFPARSDQVFAIVIASAVLTFMAFVHTAKPIYSGWLKFAAALHVVVISVLFGAVYLLVVPLFALVIWPFDVLGLRRRARPATFWISKARNAGDLRSFQRMG